MSFRDLVEFYDNETCPLWLFARVGNLIVTSDDYPIPYCFEDFLLLVKKTYDIKMFVYVEESEQLVPYSKYIITKDKDNVYFSTNFKEYEIGKDKISQKIVDEIFQPSVSFRVWNASFAEGDFYLTVDFLIDGSAAVNGGDFDDYGHLVYFNKNHGDMEHFTRNVWIETTPDIEPNDYLFQTEEKTLTLISKIYSTNDVYNVFHDDTRFDEEIVYKPCFKMFDPTPYRDYPNAMRYAIYSFLAAPFLVRMEENEITFLEEFFYTRKEYALPLLEQSYGTYYNPDEDALVYLAVNTQLTEKEMQSVTRKYGAVTYLKEYTDGVHCYKIAILVSEL
jgi:hypothetical protein